MLSPKIKKIVIEYLKELARSGIPVQKAIIFGSHAQGRAKKYSDIDLVIVSKKFGKNRIKEGQNLFKKAFRIDPRLEPIPVSPWQYKHYYDSPLLYYVHKDGIELTFSS